MIHTASPLPSAQPMSDAQPPHDAFPDDVSVITNITPDGPAPDERRRNHNPRANPRARPDTRPHSGPARPDHWSEMQELRGKLAEQDEMLSKLKAAFGMISIALEVGHPPPVDVDMHEYTPAHRPARMTRRGGSNAVSSAHYKNNNRGGPQFGGGFRASYPRAQF